MDISFINHEGKFNYRVSAIIVRDNKILVMKDERSPYFHLPGGRVMMGERAEDAIIREVKEELGTSARMVRPLWLNQSFFIEEIQGLPYHELCLYFLIDISDSWIREKGDKFNLNEGIYRYELEWLEFEALKDLYFYPLFLKDEIFNLPDVFTLRTEFE